MQQHRFSRRTANVVTAAVLALVFATAVADCAGGFRYDHWRDTVMATF